MISYLADNWLWIGLVGAFAGMHLSGRGCGMHGGNHGGKHSHGAAGDSTLNGDSTSNNDSRV